MRFDLEKHHLLLAAFDQAGRRMFGKDWTGVEAFAKPVENPVARNVERAEIVERLRQLDSDAMPHDQTMRLPEIDGSYKEASRALHAIHIERDRLKRELMRLPEAGASWFADDAAYKRRCQVEKEMADAFKAELLTLLTAEGTGIQWRSWEPKAGFRVFFDLSMVFFPREVYGRRHRASAFVPKAQLSSWLERFAPSEEGEEPLMPEERCRRWLAKIAEENPVPARTRDEYWAEARAEFSGLSRRAFIEVWRQTMPSAYKKSGRRRAN